MDTLRAAASRSNGAKSVGPVTAAGRERSSRNALKLGIFSTKAILEGESEDEYQEILDQLVAEYGPEGILEMEYIYQITQNIWRRRRVYQAETASIQGELLRAEVRSDEHKWTDVSASSYDYLLEVSDDELQNLVKRRDLADSRSRLVVRDDQKYSRVLASLDRELDKAVKGLRESQALRRSAIDVSLVKPPTKAARAGVIADADIIEG
jgi:hypothetical protein